MRLIREIRRVGFKDWFWFVVVLKRNEFHPCLRRGCFPMDRDGSLRCMRVRDRAHRIDDALAACA